MFDGRPCFVYGLDAADFNSGVWLHLQTLSPAGRLGELLFICSLTARLRETCGLLCLPKNKPKYQDAEEHTLP